MRTYQRSDPAGTPRSHPWTDAAANAEYRYRDFRAEPGLIRTSLEDFVPFAAWPATERFYRLLEWINGDESMVESNDCAFEGPAKNTSAGSTKALESTGRLMILWRDLPLNLVAGNAQWLEATLHRHLNGLDPEFEEGAVGTTIYPVRYVTLPPPPARQAGFQLMISFWAWGDNEAEVMRNLDRAFANIDAALHAISTEATA
jgi:hypothetical protein